MNYIDDLILSELKDFLKNLKLRSLGKINKKDNS